MTTFKAYLNSQRDVDSPLGRFIAASRMMHDMPDARTWPQMLAYLVARYAPADVPAETVRAALMAWSHYQGKVRMDACRDVARQLFPRETT